MLYEMECDKFVEKKNGVTIPRGKIRFYEYLNTVMGDEKGENSLGKSTFLLAVDFCFGGSAYVNQKICKVVQFVDNHVIHFAFKFCDRIEYYARSTLTPNVVKICDENYNETGRELSLDEFCLHLYKSYGISKANTSFRNMVGRYMRIHGRDNYDERSPLKNGNEPIDESIKALEMLFGVYALIKEFEYVYNENAKRSKVRKAATDIGEIAPVATSAKQVRENEKEIERLQQELDQLTMKEDEAVASADSEKLEKAAEIKGKLAVLKRRRTRLLSELNAVKANMQGGLIPTSDDIAELEEFFPDVEMRKLEQIESFHRRIQVILSDEMSSEVERLELLIAAATEEVRKFESEQRELGLPTHVSKKFLERVAEINRKIAVLQKQNEGKKNNDQLKVNTKDSRERLESARTELLETIQTIINQEMTRLNDYIYNAERYAPEIKFGNTKTGKPTYTFECKWNTGSGENYKNLIIFDLAILKATELPVLAHDSLIFKNIADLPIDQIMHLYQQSKKQIFISFDKHSTYEEFTTQITDATTVIELYDGGGELFGWSWGKKKESENATHQLNDESQKSLI